MQIHLLHSDYKQHPKQHNHHHNQQHHQHQQHQNNLKMSACQSHHLKHQQQQQQQHNHCSQRPAKMTNTNRVTTTTTSTISAHSASTRTIFWSYMILALFAVHTHYAEAKALNQYQVKLRRVPPKEFSAALGSSITIECEAGASPPPTIHWLKDGKRINQNELEENQLDDDASGQTMQVDDVSRIALSTSRSRLYIDCADLLDEATYTCVAENAYSRVSFHTKLNLIKPIVQAVSGSGNAENDLVSDEVAALSELAAASSALKALDGASKSSSNLSPLSAVPQCLSDRLRTGSSPAAPARIHMWTHNIVEIMKNSVVLLCRSNIKRPQAPQPQDLNPISSNKQAEATSSSAQQTSKPTLTWALPDDKLVSEDQKDKYELLDTGDLLIKDLSWSDMGSYVCTVTDENGSDSISSFVYPASVKAASNKRSAASGITTGRLSRFG